MAVEIIDDYSSDTSADYTVISGGGTLSVSGGELHSANGTAATFFHETAISSADHYVEADVEIASNGDWSNLIARSNGLTGTSANHYYVYFDDGKWKLARVVGGSLTWLASAASGGAGLYTARITVEGTGATVAITVEIDGVPLDGMGPYNDTDAARLTSGSYVGGTISNSNAGADVRFDNFEAGNLAAAGPTLVESSDTLRAGLADVPALLGSPQAGDTLRIGLADLLSTLLVTPSRTDASRIVVAETLATLLGQPLSLDAQRAGLGETPTVAATADSSDTFRAGLTDVPGLLSTPQSQDGGVAGLADGWSGLLAAVGHTDAQRAGLSEALAALAASPQSAEALAAGLTEIVDALVAAVASGETVPAGLADVPVIAATLSVADTLKVGFAEAAAVLETVLLASTDTHILGLTEAADLVVALSRTDLLRAGLDEPTLIAAFLSLLDAQGIGLSDTAAVAETGTTVIQVSETLGVGLSDSVTALTALVQTADAFSLGLSELIDNLLATVELLTDALPLGLLDGTGVVVAAFLQAAETLAAGLTETAPSPLVLLSHGDSLAAVVSDAQAAIAATVTSADTQALGLGEVSEVLAALSHGDVIELPLGETGTVVEVNIARLGQVIVATLTSLVPTRTLESLQPVYTLVSENPVRTLELV